MEENKALLRVRNLQKWFLARAGLFSSLFGEKQWVRAVDDVSFNIKRGEVLCLAGESGCGKTTTLRLILRLIDPTGGKVYFKDEDVFSLGKGELKKLRTKMQVIFQDPYESLNPRAPVFDIVAEPLRVNDLATGEEIEDKVIGALESVGLRPPDAFLDRYPHELSGGQRQRVGIARALVLEPEFIAADEPVSMIDVSLRADILNLMLDLKERYGLTYLFITHDLAQARYVGDRIAIMYLGNIVELGPIEKTLHEPLHPYTKVLVSNVPVPDPEAVHKRIRIKGEVPTPINPPSGCRFHPRCPFATEICSRKEPNLVEVERNHSVACHFVD